MSEPFALFPLAFLARPVGSFVFMWIDRNYGRGTKLTSDQEKFHAEWPVTVVTTPAEALDAVGVG